MKTFFSKNILIAIAMVFCGLIFTNCSKDETVVEPKPTENNTQQTTRVNQGFHWNCPGENCNFLNAGWNDACVFCNRPYSDQHNNIILSFITFMKRTLTYSTTIAGADLHETIAIFGKFPTFYPTPWYETTSALKYYNDLKKSSAYLLVPGYAQDVDYAWYRTVRILYPGEQDITQLERAYTKFLLGDGRRMSAGIKDGTKAALDAFRTCRKL